MPIHQCCIILTLTIWDFFRLASWLLDARCPSSGVANERQFLAATGESEALVACGNAFLLVADDARVHRRGRLIQTGFALGKLALRAVETVWAFAHVWCQTEAQVLARRHANGCVTRKT